MEVSPAEAGGITRQSVYDSLLIHRALQKERCGIRLTANERRVIDAMRARDRKDHPWLFKARPTPSDTTTNSPDAPPAT